MDFGHQLSTYFQIYQLSNPFVCRIDTAKLVDDLYANANIVECRRRKLNVLLYYNIWILRLHFKRV